MNREEYEELLRLERRLRVNDVNDVGYVMDEALISRKRELWEKYAPAHWQAKQDLGLDAHHLWLLRSGKGDPALELFTKSGTPWRPLHAPLATKARELRWLLCNVATVETMFQLAREGYTRYQNSASKDSLEKTDVIAGEIRSKPTLILKMKFSYKPDSTTGFNDWRWALNSGNEFFRSSLFGWMHASVPRYFEKKESAFAMENHLTWLYDEGKLNPMEPIKDLEDRCGVIVEATQRGASWTGDNWTIKRTGNGYSATSYFASQPHAAALVIRVPFDHPGHGGL